MRQKHIYILLTLIGACVSSQKVVNKKITVTVIDKNNNKPIDNAGVTLTISRDLDFKSETKNTDPKGQCSFSFTFYELSQYEVSAKKDKYYSYFDLQNNNRLQSSRNITATSDNNITLYLTPDSLHIFAYYESITPHYQIDTLIQLLRSDSYQPDMRSVIPELKWEDIPRLLEIGNDRTKITKFPRNGFSSIHQDSCQLGIISLWLIESIRVTRQKDILHPMAKFPSLTAYLKAKNNKARFPPPNNVETMEIAYQAYKNWWQTVESMERMDACKIDPLQKTNLTW